MFSCTKALLLSQKVRSWLIPVIALFGLVIVLWSPFGLKITGIMEEWMVLHSVESGIPSDRNEDYAMFVTTGVQRMRPLVGVAPIIGYDLSPDSFVGFNLVMMALFVGKGIALYLILRKLVPNNRVFALFVALLFVVYPADSGLFTFRAISIHLAVFWYLFGVYLFLVYFKSGQRWALISAWLALIGSLWIYEVAYLLIGLTPILLIWLEGHLNRRVIRATLLLYIAPLLALLYVAIVFTQGASYQSWVLQRSGLNQPSVISEMLTSLYNAYFRHFAEGWVQAINQIGTPYLALTLVTVILVLTAGRLMIRQGRATDDRKRRYWLLALLGFAVVGIGYAPFLITPYRQLDWRVYYYSSIGGAICVGSLTYLLILYTHMRPVVFVGIMSMLVGLGTLRSLNQHQYYADLGISQQELLRGIVEQVPHLKSEAPLVVVDETGRYNNNWTLGASYLLTYALRYLYSDYQLNAILCSFDPKLGQFVALPEQDEQCTFTSEGVTVKDAGSQTDDYLYQQMVLIRYSADGAQLLQRIPSSYLPASAETVYNPNQFIDQTASPPRRFYTLFSISD